MPHRFCTPGHTPGAAPGPRRAPALRTYVVLAIGAAGGAEGPRPLGTVAAPHRGLARDAARTLHPGVAPDELRVLAAAGAPTGLLARALAADGGHALAGR